MPRVERNAPAAPLRPPEPSAAPAPTADSGAAAETQTSSFTLARPPAVRTPSNEVVLRPLMERRRSRGSDSAEPQDTALRPGADVTPATHPERFTPDGQLKWKTPPPGVTAEPNTTGSGHWVERWKNPKTGEWVYNYTAAFMEQQSLHKFRKNAEFGRKLPEVLRQVRSDLGKEGRDRVLACAVECIQEAYFRVGNEESAEDKGHYGITTLESRHLRFEGDRAVFEYVGKSGQPQHKVVSDPAAVAVMRELKAACHSDTDRLFRFGNEAIQNADVNAYLDRFGVTAKQFRTYHATRLCREYLLELGTVPEKEREKAVTGVVERVAAELGHTPAVCRGSYIDPVVIEAFLAGRLR